jgi:hypothetical protein
MKKALSLLLFVLISVGMTMPVVAGELKMMNEFTVKMFNGDRTSGPGPVSYLGSQNYVTSLLGSKGSYSAEPGFSLNWWVEAAVKGWGYQDSSEDSELNYKVLFAKWDAERFAVSAGYLDLVLGNGWNLQTDGTGGFMVDLKPSKATTITLLAILADEGLDYQDDDYESEQISIITGNLASTTDAEYTSDDDYEDTWWYAIQVAHDFDGAKAKAYYLTSQDSGDSDSSFSTLGVAGNFKAMGMDISGEAATFFGNDTRGMFADVEANIPVNEKINAMFGLYYALGADDSGDTTMYQFEKRGMHQPLQTGLGPILDHDDKGLQLIAMSNNFSSIENSGMIGTALGGSFKVSPQTTLNAGIVYGMAEADEDIRAFDSLTKVNGSITYSVSKSLLLALGASYLTFSDSDTFYDDMWGTTAVMSWSF